MVSGPDPQAAGTRPDPSADTTVSGSVDSPADTPEQSAADKAAPATAGAGAGAANDQEPNAGPAGSSAQAPALSDATASVAAGASPSVAVGGAPGLKARGVFVIESAFAAVGCVIGFIVSGTTSIPTLAGWGLVIGSVVAALLSPPRLGWTAAWMPPLAITAVIAVLGQLTLLGAMPTFAREVALVAANLTSLAPAQLSSVAAAALILYLRRRRLGSG
jgi:hypothetical protein